jgi:bile acid:Na+ symporter, BASS family
VTTLIDIAVPVTTFMMLAAVGLDLTAADFARVRRQRLLVLAGLLAPLLLLPPIAVGLTRLFRAPPEIAAGALLIAACPIGSVSNAFCHIARASMALSVTLTGLSSLLASLTIPLAGRVIESMQGRPFEHEVPDSLLAARLVLVLTLPVMLGMWGRRWSPALAARLAPRLQQLAVAGILAVFALVIMGDVPTFSAQLATTVPLAIAFVLASTAAGWVTAVLISSDRGDRFAIAAGFGARNVAIATMIAVTLLQRLEFARFAATYAVVELPLLLAAAALFARSTITSDTVEPTQVEDHSRV